MYLMLVMKILFCAALSRRYVQFSEHVPPSDADPAFAREAASVGAATAGVAQLAPAQLAPPGPKLDRSRDAAAGLPRLRFLR